MIGTQEQYIQHFMEKGIEVYCPDVVQTMDEKDLIQLVPQYDGWIIGDDPATRKVFKAGSEGKLKAAVKWGIGVDNVDFSACNDFNIPVTNTPDMFGAEVADIAVGYVIALARETFRIDREIRDGKWPKYRGISLSGKNIGLVGYGDIGTNTAKRLLASDMNITVYDPLFTESHTDKNESNEVSFKQWPEDLSKCDFLVFTCSLNEGNIHMLNASTLALCQKGVRVINVARGPLIHEGALLEALQSGLVHSAALDVFENEPLPMDSELRKYPLCIFGSHNGSNTSDAVAKTNDRVINKLFHMLDVI
jgi:D-3-phosphoglycerate dehydrogenase